MAAGQDADMAKLIKILTDEAPLHTKLLEAMVRRFERGGHSVAAAPSASERQMEAAKAAAIEAFKAVKADPSDANKAALQNAEAAYYVAISDLVEDAPEDEKEFQRYILGKLKLSAIDVTGQVAAGAAAAGVGAAAAAPVEGAGGNAPAAPVEGAGAGSGGAHGVAPAGGAGGNAADANAGNDSNANSVLTSASDAESAAGSGEHNDNDASVITAGSAGGASAMTGPAGGADVNDANTNEARAVRAARAADRNAQPNVSPEGLFGNNGFVNEAAPNAGGAAPNAGGAAPNAAGAGRNAASSGGSEDSIPELERTDLEIATVDSVEDLTAKYENTCAGIQDIAPDGLCFYRAILTGLKEDASTEKSKEFAVKISEWLELNKKTKIPITGQPIEDAYGPVKNLQQHKAKGNSSRKDFNFDEYIAATIDFQGDSPNVYPELEVSGWAAANVKHINLIVYDHTGKIYHTIYTDFDGIQNKPVIKIKQTEDQNHFDLCLHDTVDSASASGADSAAGVAASNAGEVDEDNAQGSAISGMFGTNNNSVSYRPGTSESAAPSPPAAPAPPPGPPPNPPRGVLPPPAPVAQIGNSEKAMGRVREAIVAGTAAIKANKSYSNAYAAKLVELEERNGVNNKTMAYRRLPNGEHNNHAAIVTTAEFLEAAKRGKTAAVPSPIPANPPTPPAQSGGSKGRSVTPIGKRLEISLKKLPKKSKSSKKSKKSKASKSPKKSRKSKH